MKKALAIIAYARFDYFELVLTSILNQIVGGKSLSRHYDIWIFQDGLWEGKNEINRNDHSKIARMLEKLPSEIQVIRQNNNLGIALHYDFIERLLFMDKGYDFVAFCEDDLILAPGYLSVIDMMAGKFHDDPRVGMVSAHPAEATISIEQQRSNLHEFSVMYQNWGFGLSRSFWVKRQPLVDCYLDLIRDVPYRERPHSVICDWMQRIGFNPTIASTQGYVKSCATLALGALKLSTFPNFGLPIGRTGLHFNPSIFKEMGFDKTVVVDRQPAAIGDLDETQFLSLRSQCSDVGSYLAESFDSKTWQARLDAGELHPRKVVPEYFESDKPAPVSEIRKSTETPSRPRTVFEKEYLEEYTPILALISAQLVNNPKWSLKLLDVVISKLSVTVQDLRGN